jgi:anaerobic C4-dicarboxylate transporter
MNFIIEILKVCAVVLGLLGSYYMYKTAKHNYLNRVKDNNVKGPEVEISNSVSRKRSGWEKISLLIFSVIIISFAGITASNLYKSIPNDIIKKNLTISLILFSFSSFFLILLFFEYRNKTISIWQKTKFLFFGAAFLLLVFYFVKFSLEIYRYFIIKQFDYEYVLLVTLYIFIFLGVLFWVRTYAS